jgi:putative ABC transport system permease protein
MLKHIIKIITAQRASNAWLWAEMLLVSVFLWFIVDTLYVNVRTYMTPTGFHIDHTYLVSLRAVSDDSYQYIPAEMRTSSTADDLLTVIDRMRTYPGVEAISLSDASYPYNGSDGWSDVKRDTVRMHAQRRRVTADFFRVFRLTTPEGQTDPLVNNLAFNQLIITPEVVDYLYPEGNAVGREIGFRYAFGDGDSVAYRIGAVTTPLKFDDFNKSNPSFFFLWTEKMLQDDVAEVALPAMEVCLRVRPGADNDFIPRFKKDMAVQARYNNLYMLDIRPFSEVRERFIRDRMNDFKMSLSVIAFLLVNIFLGIVGTFWFRTQQRQGEMGLRIALGTTGRGLQAMLMLEGIVLLLFAFLPALLISLNIGLKELVDIELMPFTAARFLLCQGITFVLIACMISFGILYPALKTARLQPAEALHYE